MLSLYYFKSRLDICCYKVIFICFFLHFSCSLVFAHVILLDYELNFLIEQELYSNEG
jgi:hypothetical protein